MVGAAGPGHASGAAIPARRPAKGQGRLRGQRAQQGRALRCRGQRHLPLLRGPAGPQPQDAPLPLFLRRGQGPAADARRQPLWCDERRAAQTASEACTLEHLQRLEAAGRAVLSLPAYLGRGGSRCAPRGRGQQTQQLSPVARSGRRALATTSGAPAIQSGS